MKLALIPPISWISTSSVSSYQLVLPHLLMFPKYSEHYMAMGNNKHAYVILDNGEAEGVNNETNAQLCGRAVYLKADELVIPDTMYNSVETINRMEKFFKDVSDIRNDAFGSAQIKKIRKMAVIQGRTVKEAKTCIDMIMEVAGHKVHTLALPRHLVATCEQKDVRLELAEYIFMNYTGPQGGVDIHCLGAAPSYPREVLDIAKQGYVRGMDTSMPYNYAHEGWEIDNPSPVPVLRPKGYFHLRAGQFNTEVLHHNIGVYKRWASGRD